MKVPVKLFEYLLELAEREGISQTEWGIASGLSQPRVSELVRLLNAEKSGITVEISRSCTLEKILALSQGLVRLRGRMMVVRHLLKKYEEEQDPELKFYILTQIIPHISPEQQDIVQQSLYLHLKNFGITE